MQRLIITEWVHLLCGARPELSEEDARVAVRVVGGLLNSVAYVTTAMPSQRLGRFLTDMAIGALFAPMGAR